MDSNNIEKEMIDNDAAIQGYVDLHSRSINREDRWELWLALPALAIFIFCAVWAWRGLGLVSILAIAVVLWALVKRLLWVILTCLLLAVVLLVYVVIAWQGL